MPTETRPAALMLCAETPYPMEGGGNIRTASLLHCLARTRDVDLIVFRQPGEPDPQTRIPPGLARSVTTIELPFHERGQAARACRNAARLMRGAPPLVDRFSGFEAEVERAIGARKYELGVVEHFWCAPYWPQVSAACGRTALDLHNIESVLHSSYARMETGPVALAHRLYSRFALRLERYLLPRYSIVLAVSDADGKRVRGIAPGARVAVYPNAIPYVDMPARPERDAVVFSGNMEYLPNVSAVRFFRQEIWPELRNRWPSLVWQVLGKNPAGVSRYTSGDSRIEVTGPVADAIAELARAKVAVVPVLAGSGTRLKILEAWAAGTPVVSTRIGAEGLPVRHGKEILLADSPQEFASCVSQLLADQDLRRKLRAAGRELVEREFFWDAAWRAFNL